MDQLYVVTVIYEDNLFLYGFDSLKDTMDFVNEELKRYFHFTVKVNIVITKNLKVEAENGFKARSKW